MFVRHGHVPAELGMLMHDADAVGLGLLRSANLDSAAVEFDVTLVGAHDAGQNLCRGRLSGTVVSNQRMQFPFRDRQVHPVGERSWARSACSGRRSRE